VSGNSILRNGDQSHRIIAVPVASLLRQVRCWNTATRNFSVPGYGQG
jgi:hypothetical protein